MKIHMSLNIAGALKNKMFRGFTDDHGKPMHPKQAEQELITLLSQGKKYLPLGKCDNWSDEKGCLGHVEQEEVEK